MNQIFAVLLSIRIFQLFGLSPFSIDKNFRPKISNGLRTYSLLQIMLSLFAILTPFFLGNMYNNGLTSSTGYIANFLQLIGTRIAHFIILCESLCQEEMMRKFFVVLSEVDKMMKNSKIDTKIEVGQRKNHFLVALALIFYIGLQLMTLLINVKFLEGNQVSYWACYIAPYLVSCFRYFQVVNYVWFIKKRYEILNDRLEEIQLKSSLCTKQNHSNVYKLYFKKLRFSRPTVNFQEIALMRQMYEKVYVLSTIFNRSFGLSNLFSIANDFVAITVSAYFVFLSLQSWPLPREYLLMNLQTIFWCLPHFTNIFLIAMVCQLTVQKVSYC